MPTRLFTNCVVKMRRQSSDGLTTPAHTMVRAGVVKASLDWRRSFTTQFVNKRVGIGLRPKN